jgi:hypothetical protein
MSASGFGRSVPGCAPAGVGPLRLRCVAGDAPGIILPVPPRRLVAGRGNTESGVYVDLDLSNQQASKKIASISRFHAEIEWMGDRYIARDLGSRNGTFVNGQRLVPGDATPLSAGDGLKLSVVEFVVELDER